MCLPPANARICPNPPLYSAVYHRYSLKSFQLCKSAQTYWYRKYFEHIVARFQGDSSCLTIDNIKPELCPNSAPLYNPMSVVDNSAPLFFHSSHFNRNNNKFNPLSRILTRGKSLHKKCTRLSNFQKSRDFSSDVSGLFSDFLGLFCRWHAPANELLRNL